jgi:glutathione S-transferase
MSIAQKDGAGHREGTHFAFASESTKQVDAWYEAAINAGAKDNGKPGPRPNYGPNFYGAFVHDPVDGIHLECCFKEYEAPSDAPKYRVTYFDGRGRAEQIRILLSEVGAKYEDVRLNRDTFVALQKQENSPLTFGSVPLLEEGKFSLVQGGSIMSYLAKKHGLFPSNVKDGQYADAIVLGAEDLRIKMFDAPYTKAKTSKDGKSAEEAAEIDKALATVKAFVENTWNGRWAPNFERILKNAGSGFVVGKSFSHADIAVFDVVDAIAFNFGPNFPGLDSKTTPLLTKFYNDIKSRPAIKKYLETRK